MWTRICNCTHASFIPSELATQQHVEVSLAQSYISLASKRIPPRTLAFQRHQQNTLGMADDGYISTVPNASFTNRASPAQTPTRQNIQSHVAKTIGKTKARANFKSVDWHKGFASDAALTDFFNFHQSGSYVRHFRLVFLDGTLWSNTQILLELPVNHTNLASPPGQSAVGTAPGILPLLPAALTHSTRHTFNPIEKWCFTSPSSHLPNNPSRPPSKQKNMCLVYNGKAFDRSESQSSRPAASCWSTNCWQGQDHSVIVHAGKAKGHRFNYYQTLCLNVVFWELGSKECCYS